MMIVERASPNHGPRPAGVTPSLIVIHGTEGTDAGDLAWLQKRESGVSYHYLIQRDGSVFRMVADERRAWHAGVSTWQGRGNANDYSIGIGLSNRNGEAYSPAQYQSLGALLAILTARHGIHPSRIVGHYHISPGRKVDPGYHFEWGRAFGEMWARL
jgi:N-acetyl-anhydromuramyl-L-alanine amidase AmpD